MTMPTDFICAYFGKGSDGKEWTITARGFGSLKQAEKHGLFNASANTMFRFLPLSQRTKILGISTLITASCQTMCLSLRVI